MKIARLKPALLAIALLAAFRAASPAPAAPLDTRIPADAIFYTEWKGADALAPAYNESHLKGLMENTKIGEYLSKNWPEWMERATEKGADAKEIDKGLQAMNILWRHHTAAYVGPLGLENPRKPTFSLALLCEAGPDVPTLLAYFKAQLEKNPPPPEAKIAVAQDADVVILTMGEITPDKLAAGPAEKSLAGSPAYIKVRSMVQKDPAIAMYADFEKVIATALEVVNKAPGAPEMAKQRIPAVIDALGLNGLTQLCYAGGFDKKEWSEQAFVGTKGARKGLFSLVEGPAISDAALAMVPKDAAAMSVGRLDFVKMLALAKEVVAKSDPKAAEEFDKALAAMGKELGLDVEKNIVNALGDEWAAYRGAMTEEGSRPYVIVQKLRDAAAFAKTLEVIGQKIDEGARGKIKVEKLDTGKFEVTGIRLPQMMNSPSSIAWTIRGDYLYISTLEGIAAAVDQVEQKGESITASAGYKAVMATMPPVKPTTITYSEPAKIYPDLYRMAMSLLPMARMAGVELPGDLLPLPKKVAAFMPPGGTVTWVDADGFHAAGRSAFPGAAALSGNISPTTVVGVAVLGTATLMPAMGKSRELANRSYDAANLRGISQSCVIWSNENNDKMPDHLGVLILSNQISPKQLVSKRAGTQPLEVTEEMREKAKTDFAAFAKEVDAHCDYVYLGKGTMNTTDSSTVLAYEKPGPNAIDGISATFNDAHSEFVRYNGLADAFKETNVYRKKTGVSEVDVEALIKSAPMPAP